MNLIFDLSIFIHSNYYILKKIDKLSTDNLVRAVSNQIDNIMMRLNASHKINHIILCGDSDSNFRTKIDSNYKANRSHDLQINFEYFYEKISESYYLVRYDELEGDDLVFIASQKYIPNIIVSEDKDLYQCISEGSSFYSPRKKKFMCIEDLDVQFEILKKVILGCKSDNVESLVPKGKRLGEKTLEKVYLSKHKNVHKFYNQLKNKYELNDDRLETNVELTVYDFGTYIKYIDKIKSKRNILSII